MVTTRQRRRNLDKYTCDITGGMTNIAPGKDDWIRIKHPGPNKSWQCLLCKTVKPTNAKFNRHLLQKREIRKSLLYCDCGFTNDNPRSVGTHMRYCDGSPPEQHSRKLKCSFCKFSTESEAGLQVHLARNHPEVRNEQLREKVKNFKWTEQKLEFLLETVQRLKWEGVKNINCATANILPNRTETAIQKITLPEHKQVEERIKQREAAMQKI